MQGTLIKYGPSPTHVAFLSNQPKAYARHLVLVGGLTDGLLFAPYAPHLAAAAQDNGFTLVQAQLSSSYGGYGVASLDQDADEIQLLGSCLRRQHGSKGFVLMGFSTGAQDAVRYAQRHGTDADSDADTAPAPLLGVVLQGPVSDREYMSMTPELAQLVPQAKAMVAEGRGEDILFRAHFMDGAPMCARRFLSLHERGRDDDMFSSDMSGAELQGLLGHLSAWPCLILQSGADECVPDPSNIPALGARLAASIGRSAQLTIIPDAPHSCEGHEPQLVDLVTPFLQQFCA